MEIGHMCYWIFLLNMHIHRTKSELFHIQHAQFMPTIKTASVIRIVPWCIFSSCFTRAYVSVLFSCCSLTSLTASNSF